MGSELNGDIFVEFAVEVFLFFVLQAVGVVDRLLPAFCEGFSEDVVRHHSLVETCVPGQGLVQFHVFPAFF